MFNKKIKPDQIEGWSCVYETGVESEAGLVEAFLKDQDIECHILSKKDTAYNVNFGDLSAIYIYVPNDQLKAAEKVLSELKGGKFIKGDENDSDGENPDT